MVRPSVLFLGEIIVCNNSMLSRGKDNKNFNFACTTHISYNNNILYMKIYSIYIKKNTRTTVTL